MERALAPEDDDEEGDEEEENQDKENAKDGVNMKVLTGKNIPKD